ncbi:KCS2 [Scenedesmus sp. PABB004]|nr:KCS2 [Scenedesmus sp. PABB004]
MASLTLGGAQPVFLLDYAVYKPPEELRVDRQLAEERGKAWSMYSDAAKDFMVKVVTRSGLSSNGTFLPAAINPLLAPEPRHDMATALEEARAVMTGAVEALLAKTGLRACDVDILVTNCSIFCPTPSLASMLVNAFKFRPDIQSYHLGGMGCGNGVMAVGLARPNSVALFVPAEITTYAFYPGSHKTYMVAPAAPPAAPPARRSRRAAQRRAARRRAAPRARAAPLAMLTVRGAHRARRCPSPRQVANAIFRMGGAAVALTNRRGDAAAAKYALVANSRVHTGQDDASYGCMSWGPDPDGVNGVYLGKNVVACAGAALDACLRAVTPRILTWSQYAEAAADALGRAVRGPRGRACYVPDFTRCVDHFAIHAGGYAVLKGIQAGMRLPASAMLPSFAALRDYGNTSCSTTWCAAAPPPLPLPLHSCGRRRGGRGRDAACARRTRAAPGRYVMAYMESCGGVRKGARVMQVGMGGGMKAGVNVWRALRDNGAVHPAWRHLAAAPLTEADLPRAIETAGGPAAAKPAAGEPAAAADGGEPAGGKPVARKLTVERRTQRRGGSSGGSSGGRRRRGAAPRRGMAAPGAMQPQRLYVGGLTTGVSAAEVAGRFAPFGAVAACELVRAKGPGADPSSCRGFAYVTFTPKDAAALARVFSLYNGCKWRGQVLRVEPARPHFEEKLRAEWAAAAEAEAEAAAAAAAAEGAAGPQRAALGAGADGEDADTTIRITAPGGRHKTVLIDLAAKAKSYRGWFPAHKPKRLADLSWDPLPPSKRAALQAAADAADAAGGGAPAAPGAAPGAGQEQGQRQQRPAHPQQPAGDQPQQQGAAIPFTYQEQPPPQQPQQQQQQQPAAGKKGSKQARQLQQEHFSQLKLLKKIADKERAAEAQAAHDERVASAAEAQAAAKKAGKAKQPAKQAAAPARPQPQAKQQQQAPLPPQATPAKPPARAPLAGVVDFSDDDDACAELAHAAQPGAVDAAQLDRFGGDSDDDEGGGGWPAPAARRRAAEQLVPAAPGKQPRLEQQQQKQQAAAAPQQQQQAAAPQRQQQQQQQQQAAPPQRQQRGQLDVGRESEPEGESDADGGSSEDDTEPGAGLGGSASESGDGDGAEQQAAAPATAAAPPQRRPPQHQKAQQQQAQHQKVQHQQARQEQQARRPSREELLRRLAVPARAAPLPVVSFLDGGDDGAGGGARAAALDRFGSDSSEEVLRDVDDEDDNAKAVEVASRRSAPAAKAAAAPRRAAGDQLLSPPEQRAAAPGAWSRRTREREVSRPSAPPARRGPAAAPAPRPSASAMLPKGAFLRIVDNSGGRLAQIIWTRFSVAGAGNVVKVAVKEARGGKVTKGSMKKAVVVETKAPTRRPNGAHYQSLRNSGVLLSDKGNPLGNRVRSMLGYEFNRPRWKRVAMLGKRLF